MKTGVFIASTLLLLWIAGASYYFVCKVRMDCRDDKENGASTIILTQADSLTADTLEHVTVPAAVPAPDPHSVFFAFNKNTCMIQPETMAHIETIKQYLAENPGKKVLITGHSDAIGPEWAKINISSQRADFVMRKLMEAGINQSSIETAYKSDDFPASDNSTPEGRAKNRRTEITIQ